jgi:DNA-binding transcriptional MerR regulator
MARSETLLSAYRGRVALSLDDLATAVEEVLDRLRYRAPVGRVARVPDARTIRYYQTLGLVDRPADYVGGQARYGYRHLLQLVSIKLLQARFLPLGRIQQHLYGQANAGLEALIEEGAPHGVGRDEVALRAPLPPVPIEAAYEVELLPGVALRVLPGRFGPEPPDPAEVAGRTEVALRTVLEKLEGSRSGSGPPPAGPDNSDGEEEGS